MPFEDVSSTRGKKNSEERVSLVICSNASGTHKISCTLIGKPKFPACIKNLARLLKYISQNKAWINVTTCWKWFEDAFYPEVRKRTGRIVFLLLEIALRKCSCRLASWKQPCGMGIIAALKKVINISQKCYGYLRA